MKDVIAIHQLKCPNANSTVQVSVDGVKECHSNTNSLDVFSTRFAKCDTVYPLQIIRPFGKYRVDNQHYLDEFLTDVCSNNCTIEAFVGDKPKRSDAKVSKCQAAYYPCEYCESKGHLLKTQDESLKLKKKKLLEQKTVISNQLAIAEQTNGDPNQIQALKTVLQSVNDAIKNINSKHNNIVWPASTQNGPKRTQEKVI